MAESVPDTLRMLAELGYGEVEFAGYFDWAPRDLRRVLDDLGLDAPSAHVPLQQLVENRDAVFETAGEMGHRQLVVPWIGPEMRTEAGYASLAETLSTVGEAARPHGLAVAYHNHDFEFEAVKMSPPGPVGPGDAAVADGPRTMTPLEYLIRSTDPDLASFQLDLYWAAHVGHDPATLFPAHPGRFVSVHVKDRSAAGEMVDVGSGELDFRRLLAAAEAAGVRHAFVEHDNPSDPRRSATGAIRHLESLRG
jgi:sugar phosphate isomerase/epimerase